MDFKQRHIQKREHVEPPYAGRRIRVDWSLDCEYSNELYEAYRLDPILSILIALYILYKTVPEFFTTMKILLNGSPENVNVKSLADSIKNVPAVKDLSHFHIWSLDGEENALIVTVLIDPSDIDKAREIKEEIAEVAHKSA
ncbi:hypothetical protein GCM10025861_27750 (plasmid) [Methanobacterium petrolearium]|nr:hypothetical protein GCM10025861_27750 [Methanobacterium petrolearium]